MFKGFTNQKQFTIFNTVKQKQEKIFIYNRKDKSNDLPDLYIILQFNLWTAVLNLLHVY